MCLAVSVVVPIYNSGKYLDETLCALEGQTLRDIEIICVDDGSSDNSLEIIRAHQASDDRIVCIHQENSGAGVARNTGMDRAQGKWLAFLDSDDIYSPTFLERLLAAAEAENADVAVCETDTFYASTGKCVTGNHFPEGFGVCVSPADAGDALFQFTSKPPFNKLFRAKYIHDSNKRFQATKNENDLFFTQTAVAGARRIALVREPLVVYRSGGGSSIQDDMLSKPTLEKCLCPYEAHSALRKWCSSEVHLTDANQRSLDCLCIESSFQVCIKALGDHELLSEVYALYKRALLDEWRVTDSCIGGDKKLLLKFKLITSATPDDFAWVYQRERKQRFKRGLIAKLRIGFKTVLVLMKNGAITGMMHKSC